MAAIIEHRCSQNLKTNEAKNGKKLRTASLNSKFTGSYKKIVFSESQEQKALSTVH